MAGTSGLAPIERGPQADQTVVSELTFRLATVAERARERMDRLAEFDAASQDVVIEVVRALEQQLIISDSISDSVSAPRGAFFVDQRA